MGLEGFLLSFSSVHFLIIPGAPIIVFLTGHFYFQFQFQYPHIYLVYSLTKIFLSEAIAVSLITMSGLLAFICMLV